MNQGRENGARAAASATSRSGAPAAASPVPRRPVQRRSAVPSQSKASESEGRWRALAEVADILAEEVFPADAFPELSRWLAETTDAMAAVILLAEDAIDSISAWPEDDPMAADLDAYAGRPIDQRSSIWAAVDSGETITGTDDDLVMPDGAPADGVGGWVVVPLVDRTVAFGTIVVAGRRDQAISDSMVQLLHDVAARVARALSNCEEAVSSGALSEGTAGNDLPPELRDRLAALSFLLAAIDAVPVSRLAPDHDRGYREIAQQVATLEAQVQRFLSGEGGGRR